MVTANSLKRQDLGTACNTETWVMRRRSPESRPLVIISGQETPKALNAIEQAVIDQCSDRNLDTLLIPHLYQVSDSSDLWKRLAECVNHAILLCWIHPRPAQWILRQHKVVDEGLTTFNLSSFSDADSIVSAAMIAIQDRSQGSTGLPQRANEKDSSPGAAEQLKEPVGSRWYPVIDGSRCVNCQHCLQFCLFGVYELDAEGKVAVCRPDQCKPGCPACSRICPQSAIMFPLYEKDAAIAGAPGQFVALDAAARKMFYTRTKQPCPVCGRKASTKSRVGGTTSRPCPECGCPQAVQTAIAGDQPSADGLPFDDLDDMIDRLDQQMQRRR
jgi:Pyruvate/2-oxoacid:ferredoxin oxidoreductase delta subunit